MVAGPHKSADGLAVQVAPFQLAEVAVQGVAMGAAMEVAAVAASMAMVEATAMVEAAMVLAEAAVAEAAIVAVAAIVAESRCSQSTHHTAATRI